MMKLHLLSIVVLSVTTIEAAPAQRQESIDGFEERLVVGTVVAVTGTRASHDS